MKELVNRISKEVKEIKENGYGTRNIFIKLNKDKYKKRVFSLMGISVIYGKVRGDYKLVRIKSRRVYNDN